MILQDFCSLLQIATGKQTRLPHILADEEWGQMYHLAHKQALLGIAFEGVNRLPQEQWPKGDIVLKWIMAAETIKRRNRQTTEVCLRLTRELAKEGFDVCILKGQANHVYYDSLSSEQSLGMLRVCGDVDAWIWPKEKTKHPVGTIIDYCKQKNILVSLCHLHAEVKPVGGVPVEIHFRPSFLNAPWRNRCFQKLFQTAKFEKAEIDQCGVAKKLRVDYDLVFQMSHIYRHLLDEGVGMRQVLDFYVLLAEYNKEQYERPGLMSRGEVMEYIRKCGMKRFASALMFVLQDILGMSDDELLCAASAKHGTFLLNEMMAAGNFGHYDERMKALVVRKGKLAYQLQKAQRRFKRNLRFLTSYPEEVICEPFARVYHFMWRKFACWRAECDNDAWRPR